MSRRKVIGQGSYGCIHQPSLHCKENIKLDYDKYISKLMKTKNAEKELREFVFISNLDKKNEYHLGTPIICEPNIKDPSFEEDVEDCMRIDVDNIIKQPNNYRLLIQKSGGYDLSYFCKHYLKNYMEKESNKFIFWLEVYNLLKGIRFFKKHDIVHYDLKPQNIVFNPETKKFMFIDFGLMSTKTNIITRSNLSTNYSANFHWSYPIDNGFLNKDYFNYYNLSNKQLFKETFCKKILTSNPESNELNIFIKNPNSFKLFFSYIYLQEYEDNSKKYNDLNTFFESYNSYIGKHSYKTVIDRTVDSIDIYGLGFTLKFVLNQCFLINAISADFYRKTANLFEDMYNFNFELRAVSIDKIMDIYEQILLETGVLHALNKKIKNREIIDSIHNVPEFVSIASTSMDPLNLTPELEEYADKDAFEVPSPTLCKDSSKEVNPLSKRCVNKCISPKTRNAQFRCVKTPNKPSKKLTRKKCVESKEKNPLTTRCVKKCKPYMIRDNCFRCIKSISMTRKNINKVQKICNESKELNPSGRCVKKCTVPKIRDNCFRCVTKKNI